ncbi:MAG: anaerobic ribonucleoside-triphosphate reductase activating protein [Candidatus Moranbacteria bacterium]|nr:anaerobic ribonucleoside-triphosphate reductase activating protein [Candidatus Moranbacteria bacterium]
MLLSGITKLTLLDYPGKTACIVFTAGCNFRCGYCHNPEFVLPERLKEIEKGFIPEDIFFRFLERRKNLLQGVVITGGEPTLHPDLEDFIVKIRALGYAVKLDTNGNRPDVLRRLIERGLVQYVAMDFKTSFVRYPSLSGLGADAEAVEKSFDLLKEGHVPYEFRTTLIREMHTEEVLQEMKQSLQGAARYYLQPFRNEIVLDPKFEAMSAFSESEMISLSEYFTEVVGEIGIREE